MGRIARLAVAVMFLTALLGCGGYTVYTQRFTYPMGLDAYGDQWNGLCVIRTRTHQSGSSEEKLDRVVTIVVVNKQKEYLLKETLQLRCLGVEAQAQWLSFEDLHIILFEKGNRLPIFESHYEYHADSKQFAPIKGP